MLAIRMGCFLIANLKVTNKEEKSVAQEILKSIGYQVSAMRQQLIDEWKTELIELRNGQPAGYTLASASRHNWKARYFLIALMRRKARPSIP